MAFRRRAEHTDTPGKRLSRFGLEVTLKWPFLATIHADTQEMNSLFHEKMSQ
jgi:hypothetical protein